MQRAERLLFCPLPLWERAARPCNKRGWVRGSLRSKYPSPILSRCSTALPSPTRGEGTLMRTALAAPPIYFIANRSRCEPLREALLDRAGAIGLPRIVLEHRDRDVRGIARELDGDLGRDQLERLRIARPIVQPIGEVGLGLGLRGELDELEGELAVGRALEHAPSGRAADRAVP